MPGLLTDAAKAPEAELRRAALEILGRRPTVAAHRAALEHAANADPDREIRELAAAALGV